MAEVEREPFGTVPVAAEGDLAGFCLVDSGGLSGAAAEGEAAEEGDFFLAEPDMGDLAGRELMTRGTGAEEIEI